MTKLETNIIQATVYPTKALIVRKGAQKINPQKTVLTISNLPLSLDPSSIRVKGLSLTGTMIEGIDIEKISHKTSIQPKQDLIDKLEEFKRELKQLNNEVTFIDNRLSNNRNLEEKFVLDFSRYYSRGTVSLDQFSLLQDRLKDEYEELANKKITIIKQIREIEREIEIVEENINNKSISNMRDDYTISVFLHNPSEDKSDDFQLEFSYVVSGASWKPMYDFRADTDKGEISVDYFGMVSQRTGEDWNNVDLTLSTASPTIITTIPNIIPWYLDEYIPYSPP
ncbi:MAG: mucoidy inhibitor MuiA family protein, partial [Candidatus Hodarchaeales archaeon]